MADLEEPPMDSVEQVMKGLTKAMGAMLVESGPDDITGEEGLGVELFTAGQWSVARALERRELGHIVGASGLPGMYWNNAAGLEVRARLLSSGGEG